MSLGSHTHTKGGCIVNRVPSHEYYRNGKWHNSPNHRRHAVLHVDAANVTRDGKRVTMQQIDICADIMNHTYQRSMYVRNMQCVRETKRRRHNVGDVCMFGHPHTKQRPCVVISHDTCYTWSTYADSWYTIEFDGGVQRSWITSSMLHPA